jgi:iron complex transport system substrate-binding protein
MSGCSRGLARGPRRAARNVAARAVLLCCGCLSALAARGAPLPSIASINLCADQLVLALADPEQILTVSWLAADAEESLFAQIAAHYPLNYGSAEELLIFDPDVIIAGAYTSAFTRNLLARLDYTVVELPPETAISAIADNVRLVARAIGQAQRGETLIGEIHTTSRRLAAARPSYATPTVVVRPGSFTVGRHSLADDLMTLAGLRNVAAEQGLDRWGSLSMETLLRSAPELLVLIDYRAAQPSLANSILEHPALTRARAQRRTVSLPSAYWACGLPQSLESAELLQRAARE